MSQGMRWPLEAGKREETASPQSSQKGRSSADTLILAQLDEAWTYFQPPDYYKIINLCCFMPLSLC